MKATGIVRRVDDLGRIVIPKEIRRTLRIREGRFLGSSPHSKNHAHPGYETGWAWCCEGSTASYVTFCVRMGRFCVRQDLSKGFSRVYTSFLGFTSSHKTGFFHNL